MCYPCTVIQWIVVFRVSLLTRSGLSVDWISHLELITEELWH